MSETEPKQNMLQQNTPLWRRLASAILGIIARPFARNYTGPKPDHTVPQSTDDAEISGNGGEKPTTMRTIVEREAESSGGRKLSMDDLRRRFPLRADRGLAGRTGTDGRVGNNIFHDSTFPSRDSD